jgi:hypothetical protein
VTMSIDPWAVINAPGSAQALSARRADPQHPFDFFWGCDFEGRCLLLFEYGTGFDSRDKRPELSGIDTIDIAVDTVSRRRLLLLLKDNQDRELFYRFCLDLLESTRACTSEEAALHVIIRRTWRWHQLLRSGGSGKLGLEAQKGLIGELLFLRDLLLRRFSASAALAFWQGPSGAPKDFAVGGIAIEVKARRGSDRPYVRISSEFQLDSDHTDELFLYVSELEQGPADHEDAFTLKELVQSIQSQILATDPGAIELFEIRLMGAGYLEEDDYSDTFWISSGVAVYHVGDGFPRITRAGLPEGVESVEYKVDLVACRSFEIELDRLAEYISGGVT